MHYLHLHGIWTHAPEGTGALDRSATLPALIV